MSSFNKIIFMGNLTRDPQLNYLPSQTPVVEFGMAANRKWKGKDSQDREEVCFIDARCFGRLAENLNKFCKKGQPLMIEGRLSFDRWEGKDGEKRSKHYITIESFTFVGGKNNEGTASDEPLLQPPKFSGNDDVPF